MSASIEVDIECEKCGAKSKARLELTSDVFYDVPPNWMIAVETSRLRRTYVYCDKDKCATAGYRCCHGGFDVYRGKDPAEEVHES